MQQKTLFHLLRLVLVGFWALWFCLAFASNLIDLLFHFGYIKHGYAFDSDNFSLMLGVSSRYGAGEWLASWLFSLDVLAQGVITVLFVCAWPMIAFKRDSRLALLAFTASIALWSVFLLADEAFLAYALEPEHIRLFIAELLSVFLLLVLERFDSLTSD